MSQNELERRTFRYTRDTDEKPSEGVYSGVAALENCSPLELTPLGEAIEPEALDALLTGSPGTVRVTFHYYGYEVTATHDEIRIQEPEKR